MSAVENYGEAFLLGSILFTAYQYAEVSLNELWQIHARYTGWSTWVFLNNHYWAENGPCKDGVEYKHHEDSSNTYCNFFHDPSPLQPSSHQGICWENSPIWGGLAKMFDVSGNPFSLIKFNLLKETFDQYHWNPSEFNPYPDPEACPLKLGYCYLPIRLPDFKPIPSQPGADFSDNVGIALALTQMYKSTENNPLVDHIPYKCRAQEIFDTVLGNIQYTGPEHQRHIGYLWTDVIGTPPYDIDVPGQFIGRHHLSYKEDLHYQVSQHKCVGCNFILLNGLYEFLNAKGEWPEEWPTWP